MPNRTENRSDKRRICAILVIDVVGSSRHMRRDEAGTLRRFEVLDKEVFQPHIRRRHGRIFNRAGDSWLAEFGSIVDAVQCAVAIQADVVRCEAQIDHPIQLRIAVNLGDVIVRGKDLYGDGVNVAAHLQQVADPGGIVLSGTAYDHLSGKLDYSVDYKGEVSVKDLSHPFRVYALKRDGAAPSSSAKQSRQRFFGLYPLGVATALLIGGAMAAWWLIDPDPPPTIPVSIANSSGKEEWLEQAITSFNAASQTNKTLQVDAAPIRVEVVPEQLETGKIDHYRSGSMITDIVAGKIKPTIASPAEHFWIARLKEKWQAISSEPITKGEAPGVARSPIVLAMWESRARALECWPFPKSQCTWERIRALALNPDGWGMFGRPDWGRFKLGYGYMDQSNSGTLTVAMLCMRGLGKSEGLTLEDVDAENGCGHMIADVERAKVYSGKRSAWLLGRMRSGGPEYLDAAVTNEQELVEFNNDLSGLREQLVAVYPQDGTMFATHPVAILEGAPWVSAEKAEAARIFRDYLLSAEQQSLLVKFGLRPIDPKAPLGTPLDAAHGANPDVRIVALEVPDGVVFDRVAEVWRKLKKQAQVAIVFDKSRSMAGDKIGQGIRGAKKFVQVMDPKDWLDWITYDDRIYARTHGLISETGSQLESDISSTTAFGGSALYDAVAATFDALAAKRKTGQELVRYGIVIIAASPDTSSTTTWDALEAKLRVLERDPTGIQIHTVAIGDEADQTVLRKIASLAHGRYWQVTKSVDVDEVFGEIATHF